MSESASIRIGPRSSQLPWRAVGVTTALVVLASIALGAARAKIPDEIRAKRFTLVDQGGTPIASLAVNPKGDPMLRLSSRAGVADMTLKITNTGTPTLTFFDETVSIFPSGLTLAATDGRPRATLESSSDGSTSLRLYTTDSRPIARLVVTPEGTALIELQDRLGMGRVAAGESDGALRLVLGADQNGAELAVRADGSSTLVMQHDGKSRVTIDTQLDGPARLALGDRNGKPRAGLTVLPGGSTEVLPSAR
jgi:hypothetical protein